MISRASMLAGCAFAGTSVILGAFGAHGLRSRISPEQLQSFETGVRYQLAHALALLFIGLLASRSDMNGLRYATYLFMAGILLFSGSIYLLSTRELTGLDGWKSFLGPVTPIGGLLLIAGWCALGYTLLRTQNI
jgi:uncharacterized membrane protein YgdD (TMEM256/DUF423 family)